MAGRADKWALTAGFALLFGLVWHFVWMSGDGWWHLALGREIFGCACLPKYNDLAFTGHWTTVLHQQWLPYILYYGAYKTGGYPLVYIIAASLVAGSLALSVVCGMERGGSPTVAVILAAIGVLALKEYISVRSESLIDLLFALEVLLITRALWGKKARLWALVPIFILWANSHSSLPMAMAYPAIVGLGVWLDRGRERETGGGRGLLLWVGLSCLATLLNPYGPGIYSDIISRLTSPSVHIIEIFKSPDFQSEAGLPQLAWLALLWVGMMVSPRESRAADLAVAGAFSLLFLNAQRYFIFLLIATLPMAAEHWTTALERRWSRPALKWGLAAIFLFGGFCLMAAPRLRRGATVHVDKAAGRLSATGFKGRVFNYYTWGGFLLWEHPELNIFIDGRNNIYEPSGVFDDYVKASRGGMWWGDIFHIYRIEAVIWPVWGVRLFGALRKSPDWKLIFVEGDAAVFVKKGV